MSDQLASSAQAAQFQRMGALLHSLGRFRDFNIWIAHFELFKRELIAYEIMQYGLDKIYFMLNDARIRDLHNELLSAPNHFTDPMFSKEDYKRLSGFIDIVYTRQEPVDDVMGLVFDSMLGTQMLLIQKVQNERQIRLFGEA
ncbi:Nn.00g092600.m01.CDS01 [Neocucurbitaria sp. VM-36]